MSRKLLLSIALLLSFYPFYSQQFDIAGSATDAGNLCYELTSDMGESGAVWNQNTIDLTQPFNISVTLSFGDVDSDDYSNPPCGADGISFILQPNGTGVSATGGGVGFEGITPSFGVVMDTYSANPTDPLGDHISIHQNGDHLHGTANELVDYGSAAGFPYNVEDGADHTFQFSWTPGGTAEVYFDGNLMFSYTGDIVNDIFGGNPNVFWGFSASSGACWNLQTVCFDIMADFDAAAAACPGEEITFTDQSQSTTAIVAWDWDFGDGSSSTDQNPTHSYTTPGTYNVILEVTDMGGFTLTNTMEVEIYNLPNVVANADNNPVCEGTQVTLTGSGANTYVWDGGITDGIAFNPVLGTTTYNVTGTDANGCENTTSIDVIVNTNPEPTITGVLEICTGGNTSLDAGSYAGYLWSTTDITQTINATGGGNYDVTVTDVNGCTGTTGVTVVENSNLNPGITGDLQMCEGFTTTLDVGAGYTSYLWSTTDITQTITINVSGTYSVTVEDANGCSGTASVDVTENSNPSPSISGNLFVCEGNTTTLDAGAGYVGYLWSCSEFSQTIDVSIGNYFVTVSDANGCTGTDQVTVAAWDNPTPEITGDPNICTGDNSTLNAGSFQSYLWNTTEVTPTIVVNTGGNYAVTVTDVNGCKGTDEFIVVENALPNAEAGSDVEICDGAGVRLDASGGVYYQWNTGENTASINVNPQNTTTYSVTVTDANGCSGSNNVTVSIIDVMVELGPDMLVCQGADVTLTASLVFGSHPATYNWSTSAVSSSLSFTAFSDESYYVTMTDAHGCTATDQINVGVYPDLNFTLFADETEICEGESVQFSGTFSGGTGGPYFLLYNNQLTGLPYVVRPSESTTYTFVLEDMCGQRVEQSIDISVNELPDFTIQSNRVEACPPEIISFNVLPVSGTPYETYQWSFDDYAPGYSVTPNAMYQYENDGVFDVTLTVQNSNGCQQTHVFEDYITIHPNPVASFIPESEITSFIDANIYFENTSVLGDYFIWQFGDGDSSNMFSPMHTFENIQSYPIQLVVNTEFGCTDTAFHQITITDEYSFYAPNAFTPNNDGINDIFYVVGNSIRSEKFHFYVYDRWGEIVYHTDEYNAEHPEWSGWDGRVNGSQKK